MVECLSDLTSGTRERAFLLGYMQELAERLRHVRVCCGDWSRICGPSPTFKHGITAVFLDPPYADEADRQSDLYASDSGDVAHAVREWAIANGDNPLLRIALCGYQGEHQMPDTWECVAWKARGGYGSQGSDRGRDNADRERLWFSPHCLTPGGLFDMIRETETEHCDREIAEAEGLLREGHPDIEGLVMCLRDWSEEKRLIEAGSVIK